MRRLLKREMQTWSAYFMPLAFTFTFLIDIALFYTGFGYQENIVQKYGYMVLCSVFALLTGIALLPTLYRAKLSRKQWVLLIAVLLFYVLNYGVSFARFGFTNGMTSNAAIFIVMGLPRVFAGFYVALNGTLSKFFPTMEKLSFFVLPAAFVYFNGMMFLLDGAVNRRGLGMINYMSFAYGLMDFLLCHAIQFVRKEKLILPFSKVPAKHPQLLRGTIIFLYWINIIASGTRGTYVCVIGFCTLLLLLLGIYKKGIVRACILSVVLTGTLLFNLFVYAPQGMAGVHRMDILIDGIKEGTLTTTSEKEDVRENIDDFIELAPESTTEMPGIGDRGTLYLVAIKEFLKTPITGMGPGGFLNKYDKYPHNIPLEIFCELGLIGALPIFALIIWAIVKLFRIAKDDMDIQGILLIFLTYAIMANISGSIWRNGMLPCAVVFAIVCPCPEKSPKRNKV